MGRVFFNTRENTASLTGTYTILASDSGKTFFVDQSAAFTATLPADQEGLNFTFILVAAGSNDVKIDSGASNGIKGWGMDVTATLTDAIDNNLVKFVSGASIVGDVIRLVNDGATWWCESHSGADGGIVGANS